MIEMSVEEFARRYAAIESTHDRDLARLFVESGWTQERIAEQIGKSQSWVDQHLRFGRFLNFTTNVVKLRANLTEGLFRSLWDVTDQKLSEQDRFQSVCRALGVAPPPTVPNGLDIAILNFARSNLDQVNPDKHMQSYVKALFTKGTEHVRQMVGLGKDKVGLERAYYFVRHHSPEEQNQASFADVIGFKYRDRSTGRRVRMKKKQTRAPKPAPVPPAPRTNFTKLDVGTERIHGQPVQLYPASVQRLLEARIRANGIVSIVTRIGTDPAFTAEHFWKDVDSLLTHVPVIGKKNGEETNYAKPMQASLELLAQHIGAATARLCAFRDSIAERLKEKPDGQGELAGNPGLEKRQHTANIAG